MQKRAAAGLRRHLADPAVRQAHLARSREHLAAWRATDKGAAESRAVAMRNLARAAAPELREARIRGIRAARHPGIPESRWDEAVALAKVVGSEEAHRIIRDEEAERERRRVAGLTKHERDVERLRAGATLIEVRPLRRVDHDFTLGGVGSGLL